MWDLAVREEDYAKADSLFRRKYTPDKRPLGHRAILATVRRDSAWRTQLLQEARQETSGYPEATWWLALYLNDFRAAEEFARAALASSLPRHFRDEVRLTLAWVELAQGRWKTAKSEFALVERSLPLAKRMRALSATWPFLAVADSELVAIRAELDAWDPHAEAPKPTPGRVSTLQPQLRLYLLGLLSSRLGNQAESLRHAAELEKSDHPPEAAALVRDLARTIRADVEWRQGRPAEALELLKPVKGEVPADLLGDPVFGEDGARYLRAELLYQLGRDREALEWFSHGFQGRPSELVYQAPGHLRQAEIYERLGDRQQAIDHYSRFIQLWKSCDPEQRPSVERARARLAVLVGEQR
jgi:tetratricopeptide (TPR) repeat protein